MEKEKRLIDAEALKLAIRDDPYINGSHYAAMKKHINDCTTVEVVRRADLIDRTKLIENLKAFKICLGDFIFGFVVDRVIEQVKAQPAAEVKADNIAMIDVIEHTTSGLLEED